MGIRVPTSWGCDAAQMRHCIEPQDRVNGELAIYVSPDIDCYAWHLQDLMESLLSFGCEDRAWALLLASKYIGC